MDVQLTPTWNVARNILYNFWVIPTAPSTHSHLDHGNCLVHFPGTRHDCAPFSTQIVGGLGENSTLLHPLHYPNMLLNARAILWRYPGAPVARHVYNSRLADCRKKRARLACAWWTRLVHRTVCPVNAPKTRSRGDQRCFCPSGSDSS